MVVNSWRVHFEILPEAENLKFDILIASWKLPLLFSYFPPLRLGWLQPYPWSCNNNDFFFCLNRNEVWRYQPCFKPIPWWRYIFRGFPMGAGLFVVAVGLEKLFSKDDGHGHHWPRLPFIPSKIYDVQLVKATTIFLENWTVISKLHSWYSDVYSRD